MIINSGNNKFRKRIRMENIKYEEDMELITLEESEKLKVFHSVEELLKYLDTLNEEVMVMGGGKIYNEFLRYATKLILTEVEDETEADTYFPKFDKSKYQKEVLCTHEDNGITYTHVIYKK